VPNALNLDLACTSGAGARLDQIGVVITTPDPQAANPTRGPRTLEGGPGCHVAPGARDRAPSIFSLASVLAALGVARRGRPRTRARS
jgi:hypothetical protein